MASSPGREHATMTGAEALEVVGAAAEDAAEDAATVEDACDEEAEEEDTGFEAAAALVATEAGAEADGLIVGAWAWPSIICVTGATVVAA